jgi:hypothetical protein
MDDLGRDTVEIRDGPDTIEAYAVGAVNCRACGGIHIDLLDENNNVVATGFLTYAQWADMIAYTKRGGQ